MSQKEILEIESQIIDIIKAGKSRIDFLEKFGKLPKEKRVPVLKHVSALIDHWITRSLEIDYTMLAKLQAGKHFVELELLRLTSGRKKTALAVALYYFYLSVENLWEKPGHESPLWGKWAKEHHITGKTLEKKFKDATRQSTRERINTKKDIELAIELLSEKREYIPAVTIAQGDLSKIIRKINT